MTWTSPFTAFTGNVIAAGDWNNSGRDNLIHLRTMLPDPSGVGQLLRATNIVTPTAVWTNPAGDSILTPGSVTGNASGSAIGAASIASDRLVTDTITESEATRVFADQAITGAIVKDGTLGYAKLGLADDVVPVAKITHGAAGQVPISNGTLMAMGLITPSSLDSTGAPSADGQVLSWNSALSKMAWVTLASVAGVPSGAMLEFQTVAAVPSGYTICDGRSDGVTNTPDRRGRGAIMSTMGVSLFGQTFTENTSVSTNSTYAHTHTDSGHYHGMGPGSSSVNIADNGSGHDVSYDSHEHSITPAAANIQGTTHINPSYIVVVARKN